jgi:hypothetical protein
MEITPKAKVGMPIFFLQESRVVESVVTKIVVIIDKGAIEITYLVNFCAGALKEKNIYLSRKSLAKDIANGLI